MRSSPESTIWVMEDREDGTAAIAGAPARPERVTPAAAIAGRLGLPYLRVGEGRMVAGGPPALILSSGQRAAARAMLHKARHGGVVVHCLHRAALLPSRWLSMPFDLLVAPESARASRRPGGGAVLRSVGTAQLVSPALLARARVAWRERLSYLPWPRLALVLGGGAPDPGVIADLARRLTASVRAQGGCILAATLPDCQPAAAVALAQGLSGGTHLLHHAGEPGPDPLLGFLGGADAVVVAWTGSAALLEACAADGPVFVAAGVPGEARSLARVLLARGQIRVWRDGNDPKADPFASWARTPLDESGRIAMAILRRYERLWNRSLEPDLPEQA